LSDAARSGDQFGRFNIVPGGAKKIVNRYSEIAPGMEPGCDISCNQTKSPALVRRYFERDEHMKKTAITLATVAALGAAVVTAPAPAEARGIGPGLGIGLAVGALAAGAAASSYYGPYGYYGPRYYRPRPYYGPAYYGGPYAYYGGPYRYHHWHHRHWRHHW